MRLLKLMAYGVVVYTAYQFFKGMGERAGRTVPGELVGRGGSGETPGLEEESAGGPHFGQIIGGVDPEHGGIDVRTTDAGGTTVRHKVGRGVVTTGG